MKVNLKIEKIIVKRYVRIFIFMSDLVKNIMVRVLIEMNKRVGIQVTREVEENADNEIKESLKDFVYSLLVKE